LRTSPLLSAMDSRSSPLAGRTWPDAKVRTRVRLRNLGALAAALLLHAAVLGLLSYLNGRPVPRFAVRTGGSALRVTLVAAPTPPAPHPSQPVIPHSPVRQKQVLAARHPSVRTITQTPTQRPAPAPIPSTQTELPVPSTKPEAVTAPSGPHQELPLPGAQSARDIAHVACHFDQPQYPSRARRLGHEGTVLVRVTIDPEGTVTQADVSTSSGFDELDAAAREALLAGRCEPYIQDNVPVSVHALQPINFQLNN
jgi:periplasmic protein TonB